MDPEMAIKLQFLGPEIVIMVLGPETDNMLQFMDPESVNKGERSYITTLVLTYLYTELLGYKGQQCSIDTLGDITVSSVPASTQYTTTY